MKDTPIPRRQTIASLLAIPCRPAVAILNRLSYVTKFLLVGVLLLAPFGYVTHLLIKASDKQIDFNQKESYGVEYITPASRLLRGVQDARLYAAAVLAGGAYDAALARARSEVDALLPEIDAVDAKYRESFRTDDGQYPCSESWDEIKRRWGVVRNARYGTAAESNAAHTELSSLVSDWILNGVANYSNLILDPDLDSYWLMDAFVARLPGLAEDLSKAGALAVALSGPGAANELAWSASERFELTGLNAEARAKLDALVRVNFATAFAHNTAAVRHLERDLAPSVHGAVGPAERFLDAMQAAILAPDAGAALATEPRIAELQRAMEGLYALYTKVGPELDSLILARVRAYQRDKTLGQAAAAVATFLLVYLFIALFLAVRQSIATLGEFTSRMIAGTTEWFALPGRDELGRVAEMYNEINAALLQTRALKEEVETRERQLTEVNEQVVGALAEQKRLEGQLVHAQKLESIGQLAAGIAHEINTPTQYVGDNVRFLEQTFNEIDGLLEACQRLVSQSGNGTLGEVERTIEQIDVDYLRSEIPKAIQESIQGLDRVTEIVRATKAFSHPESKEKKPTDLNGAIATTLTVARNEWKYVADAVTEFDGDLPLVPCLPGELSQVFLNVIVNAAHAIAAVEGRADGEKGRITVRTRRDGEWAEILISDTGTGIPESARSKVFDPFFTTKEVGKGTGQGLAIAHSVVVRKHGGTIGFDTELGRGTTFVIRLPLVDPAADTASERALA